MIAMKFTIELDIGLSFLLQLATVDLTLRRYDTDGRRSDEHRAARNLRSAFNGSGKIVQRGRHSRRVICIRLLPTLPALEFVANEA
jgi:hypothetical protein